MIEELQTDILELVEPTKTDKKSNIEILKDTLITRDLVIEKQPLCMSLGEHSYKGYNYPTPLFSYGDFSCIVGESKSKKTWLKSLLEASYIGGQTQFKSKSEIIGHDQRNKYVISFDTEQSKYHTKRVSQRVDDLVGSPYENYLTFSLREYSAKERFEFIDWVILESDYRDNLGYITIDGGADLVQNFNDLEECSKLSDKFLKWSSIGNCHITTILHKNFGTDKPVGHIGSAILKKCESVIYLEKDEEFVKVTPRYTRNYPFETFRFFVNEQGLPEVETDVF